jgi:hypothetical protein
MVGMNLFVMDLVLSGSASTDWTVLSTSMGLKLIVMVMSRSFNVETSLTVPIVGSPCSINIFLLVCCHRFCL